MKTIGSSIRGHRLPLSQRREGAAAPRLWRAASRTLLVSAVSLALIAGCQTVSTDVTANGSTRRTTAPPERPKSSGSDGSRAASQRPSIPGRPDEALDPCAERLHALCAPLLFYYLQNRQLPPTLQDLQESPELIPPLICPTSRKPYVYLVKKPIPIDNPKGYILVHDADASHDGSRWAIVISAGTTAQEPMIAKAIGIKEDRFAVLRSRASGDPQAD